MILNNDFLTEDEYYDRLRLETLDDRKFDAASTISESVLGFTALALLGGFGGALIAKSVGNKKGKVKGFFKRIFGKKKEFDFDANKNRAGLKELCRLYEVLADYYYDKNTYQTDASALQRYFDMFCKEK